MPPLRIQVFGPGSRCRRIRSTPLWRYLFSPLRASWPAEAAQSACGGRFDKPENLETIGGLIDRRDGAGPHEPQVLFLALVGGRQKLRFGAAQRRRR